MMVEVMLGFFLPTRESSFMMEMYGDYVSL
jgi:hypothetical protein